MGIKVRGGRMTESAPQHFLPRPLLRPVVLRMDVFFGFAFWFLVFDGGGNVVVEIR